MLRLLLLGLRLRFRLRLGLMLNLGLRFLGGWIGQLLRLHLRQQSRATLQWISLGLRLNLRLCLGLWLGLYLGLRLDLGLELDLWLRLDLRLGWGLRLRLRLRLSLGLRLWRRLYRLLLQLGGDARLRLGGGGRSTLATKRQWLDLGQLRARGLWGSIAWVWLGLLVLCAIRVRPSGNTQGLWLRSVRYRLRGGTLLWRLLWICANGWLRVDVGRLSVV